MSCTLPQALAYVYLTRGWNLYAFDTTERKAHVVDPTMSPHTPRCDMRGKHGDTLATLLDAFIRCGTALGGGAGKLAAVQDWSYEFHGTYNNQRYDNTQLQCCVETIRQVRTCEVLY
jgi:hypothetical protein